jgi:hypothetical protein
MRFAPFALVVVAACGARGHTTGPDAAVDVAAAANAAGAIQFVAVTEAAKERWRAAVPDGWQASDILAGVWDAPAALGLTTRIGIDSNCDGECVAKDWAAVVDRVELAPLAPLGFKTVKDEALPGGRIVVARADDGRVRVVAAWWREGAPVYFACKARLEPAIAASAASFEAACRGVRILKWTE